ncbi:uncharacterized protein LOC116853116 [Odontomachus brunneus]|uniref:uncharacterized protein LOC116853116 n=1 Tax=Odontomachus brunneus TaxID=486640 RepID=UPI0013F2A832|nr:uncharacterized protein LOC116853116 [Odontomachus brunneus]
MLKGITSGSIPTLGSVSVTHMGFPIKLHVVSDDFPIPQEGILGTAFLSDAGSIDFKRQVLIWQGIPIPLLNETTVSIPARTRGILPLKILNSYIKEGYVPRLPLRGDVFAGDAVVSNCNGVAYMRIVNTGETDLKIPIPTIELEEFDIVSKRPRASLTPKPKGIPAAGEKTACINKPTLGTGKATRAIETKDTFDLQTPARLGEKGDNRQMCFHVSHSSGNEEAHFLAQKRQKYEELKTFLRLEHLNNLEADHVGKILRNHSDIFRLPNERLGFTNATRHKITTTNEIPINTKQYRFPPIHKEEINKQVQDLLDNGVIEPSNSPYNSPLWIVPKKPDSKGNKRWRMVIDYRALNEKTIGEAYPLPNITEISDQLGSAKYFSVFDLTSGFHQIEMDKLDAHKTAFSTPHGHYQFSRMPFGLKNAPATFQRLMDQILTGLQGTELFVYLDDIVLYASSLEEHSAKFTKLAEKLRAANLKLQPDKCEFLRKEVSYLGHIIGKTGVKPDPKKIEAVKNFPRPANSKNVKQFLGLSGYYRRFIPNFSKIAKPLTNLLKKDATFEWKHAQEQSFASLRYALCTDPILQYPDFTRPFVITTDASGYAIGGILSQGEIGKDLPIAYASRLLNSAEQNYSTIEKELLAIVYSVQHFRPYLYGRQFKLVTDHRPLVWLHSVKDPSSRLFRWRLKLLEYEYEVVYKGGKINGNADALSRNPPRANLFPLTANTESSDSDESLFSTRVRSTNLPNPEITDISNGDPDHESTNPNIPNDEETDQSDVTSTTDSTDSSDSTIFERINEPYQFGIGNIHEIKDNFLTRKDHRAIFVTQKGDPCDQGAKMLRDNNLLPPLPPDTMLGRARVIPGRGSPTILLVIKERTTTQIDIEILQKAIQCLKNVCMELNLASISMCKGNIEDIPSPMVENLIKSNFEGITTKILLCTNKVQIPPLPDRRRIIEENHASTIGGHKGITKTYLRIKGKYQWPNLKTDVQTYIRNCRNCQLKNLVRVKTRQPMVLTDTPKEAFEKISMDIMGPLPTTSSGNSYILTIQDLLTKYSLAIPLKQATAIDIAEAFVNNFICTYGTPRIILTDQGSHFINSLMKAISKKFKIKQCRTTAYYPQSNGSVERSHHVLWEYLKQYTNQKEEWDEFITLAMFSYNTSVHESTNYTPHELVFGKIARTPSDNPPLENNINDTYNEYLINLFNRIRTTQEIARNNLKISKVRSKLYYDQRANPQIFQVNDRVYLLKEPSKGKLGDQYTGPYEIIKVLDNNNVKIKLSDTRNRIVHSNKLRIDKAQHPSRRNTPTTIPGPSTSIGNARLENTRDHCTE